MGRSQRHMILEQNAPANGEAVAQGQPAPTYINQYITDETPPEQRQPPDMLAVGDTLTTPVGPAGGPLQGSTLAGAIPENLPTPPEPLPAPTLTNISPITAIIGSADVTLVCTGTGFVQGAVVLFNNSANETTFVSDTEVSTIVEPSTASGAWTVPVAVKNPDGQETGSIDFSFTEEAVTEEGETPLGPFTITRVEDHEDGLLVTLAGGNVLQGDTVLIEATGNTSVNGSYEVLSAASPIEVVVDNDYILETPIEAKGRLTITDHAV